MGGVLQGERVPRRDLDRRAEGDPRHPSTRQATSTGNPSPAITAIASNRLLGAPTPSTTPPPGDAPPTRSQAPGSAASPPAAPPAPQNSTPTAHRDRSAPAAATHRSTGRSPRAAERPPQPSCPPRPDRTPAAGTPTDTPFRAMNDLPAHHRGRPESRKTNPTKPGAQHSDARLCPGGGRCSGDGETEEVLR